VLSLAKTFFCSYTPYFAVLRNFNGTAGAVQSRKGGRPLRSEEKIVGKECLIAGAESGVQESLKNHPLPKKGSCYFTLF